VDEGGHDAGAGGGAAVPAPQVPPSVASSGLAMWWSSAAPAPSPRPRTPLLSPSRRGTPSTRPSSCPHSSLMSMGGSQMMVTMLVLLFFPIIFCS
jgi:hypothetical protein